MKGSGSVLMLGALSAATQLVVVPGPQPLRWAVSIHPANTTNKAAVTLQMGSSYVLKIGLKHVVHEVLDTLGVRVDGLGHSCATPRYARELQILGQAPWVIVEAPAEPRTLLQASAAFESTGRTDMFGMWVLPLPDTATTAAATLRITVSEPVHPGTVFSVVSTEEYISVVDSRVTQWLSSGGAGEAQSGPWRLQYPPH